jgi:hypothetical protein
MPDGAGLQTPGALDAGGAAFLCSGDLRESLGEAILASPAPPAASLSPRGGGSNLRGLHNRIASNEVRRANGKSRRQAGFAARGRLKPCFSAQRLGRPLAVAVPTSKPENGGERGIRTLGTGYYQYDGLANRCFRPLSHLSTQGGKKVGEGAGGVKSECEILNIQHPIVKGGRGRNPAAGRSAVRGPAISHPRPTTDKSELTNWDLTVGEGGRHYAGVVEAFSHFINRKESRCLAGF